MIQTLYILLYTDIGCFGAIWLNLTFGYLNKAEKVLWNWKGGGSPGQISRTKVRFRRLYIKKKKWNDNEKVLVIERAAGALAKFPGHKSDLKDFEELKKHFWNLLKNEQITCTGRDQGATAEYLI